LQISLKAQKPMDPKDFKSNAAGSPRMTATGYWAFVPAPLPPSIPQDDGLMLALSQADAALSELSGLGRYLPNPSLLIRPYMGREAVASSRIEGTQADLADLMLDEVEPKRTALPDDVREVRNYRDAMNAGIEKLEKLPLSGRLVRELHAILMRGVRGQERTPGEFRRSQNWIGGSSPANAVYVPPPHDPEMKDCLTAWETFLHRRDQMPDLIQCALMHEHFEAIHPFLDGNGRIGRLLITLFLMERKRLSKPLLYLSSYIEQHKGQYYDCLQRIRTHGDWLGWLHYFLAAVRDTARSAVDHADRILHLRDEYRSRLQTEHRALSLLEELFINPHLTVAWAAKRLGVSVPTATKAISVLERAGLVKQTDNALWGRLWVAQPILDLLQEP
jgi:Fic family protein